MASTGKRSERARSEASDTPPPSTPPLDGIDAASPFDLSTTDKRKTDSESGWVHVTRKKNKVRFALIG